MSDDLRDYLCWYDPRNPGHVPDEDGPDPREPGCACDNCFYGRDALALKILTLRALLTEAMTALGPYARLDEGWRDLERRVDEALGDD